MIIGLTGAKFSGKDTVGEAIIQAIGKDGRRAQKVSFAGPLKQALCAMFGWTREQLEDHEFKETPEPITGKTPRLIMQLLGTEFGREALHPEVWLRLADAEVVRMQNNQIVPIITDVRFENESEFLRSRGGILIHVVNPATVVSADTHVSETGVAQGSGDRVFVNDKFMGLDPVRQFAREIAKLR